MLVLLLVLVLGAIPLLAVLLALLLPAATPHPGAGSPLDRVDRTTRTWRLVGALAGAAGAVLVQGQGPLGSGLMLAGPVLVLGILTGVLIGELRVSAPTGPRRSAALEVRRLRDYVDKPFAVVVAVALTLLVAVLAATTATASPDDLGRAGRSLVLACGRITESRGPWPGSFYSVPLVGIVAGGILAAAVALRRIVARPRQDGPAAIDDDLRRQAVRSVVAAVGLLVAVPLAGVLWISAVVLGGMECFPAGRVVAAVGGFLVLPALGVAAWSAATLLIETFAPRAGTRVGTRVGARVGAR